MAWTTQGSIAALVIKDGNAHFTAQYAKDGVNFEIASTVSLMPDGSGPFVPDALTDTTDGALPGVCATIGC